MSSFVACSARIVFVFTWVLLGSLNATQAQTIDWINPTGEPSPYFELDDNWAGGAVPTASQTARFNLAATYEVWWDPFTGDRAVGFLNVRQGNVIFDNRELTAFRQYLLMINGSGGAGSFSDFSISGAGTTLTNRGLHLQSLGGGEIITGATLTLDGSDPNGAKLTVNGGTGFDVSGILNVQAGGIFDNTTGYIGRLSGTSGNATVSGSGSQWNNSGGLYIGSDAGVGGSGTLTIADSGLVDVTGTTKLSGLGTLTLGGGSLTTGTFDNTAGGTFNFNSGTLNITDVSQDLSIEPDYFALSNGTAFNTGSGTTTLGTEEHLQVAGTATLVRDATLTLAGGSLTVGTFDNTAGGTFNFNSGTLAVNGSSGTFSPGAGSFTLDGNSSSANPTLILTAGATGTFSGDFTVGANEQGTLNISGGSDLSNTIGYIGYEAGSVGVATVTGSGSQWNNSGGLFLGGSDTFVGGVGTLNIQDSAQVNVGNDLNTLPGTALTVSDTGTNGNLWVGNGSTITNDGAGFIGLSSDSTGVATVSGSGSQWNNSGSLSVGEAGNGTLNIVDGGLVSNDVGFMGYLSGTTGTATVSGSGSQWNSSSDLSLGGNGNGTLNVESGGLVSNTNGFIGDFSGSTGTATVSGSGSQWNNSGSLSVGQIGNGTLNIEAGGLVFNTDGYIGRFSGSTGNATVSDRGSFWNNSGILVVGEDDATGTLNVLNGGVVNNTVGYVGGTSTSSAIGLVTVSGIGSQWNNTGNLFAGIAQGSLNILDGGLVSNAAAYIGVGPGGPGNITVDGSGSQWNLSEDLYVSYTGNGVVQVTNGGVINNRDATVGHEFGSTGIETGIVTIRDAGSQWNNYGDLYVARYFGGVGTLNVESGGVVSNTNGYIGLSSGSTGTATVTGTGSQWNNSDDLYIGGSATSAGGSATLNIAEGGLVSVTGTTTIYTDSNVNLTGGRFEFGETSLQEFAMINATSGSMAGVIANTAYTDVATLTPFQNPTVDLTEVRVSNSGTLYGDASLGIALRNDAAGQVETVAGERMRFAGIGSTNAGEINNFGGQIRFDQDLTNQSGALIGGRGQFFADGGWTNDGVMAMSGGFADIHGDISNTANGVIAIGGGSTTTFYDDVTMDAANLNVEIASDSYGVFFGSYNGGSTGAGTLQAFGDLRPGNSPAIVSFGGDLDLGANTATYIELGGLLDGEFDQLHVAGDFNIAGTLDVSLIDGFGLDFNQEFLIADIDGVRSGFFNGLDEGDLIGNYGGFDLFITYGAGNGNDISFFTSVPEPGTAGLIGGLMLGLMMRRRSRRLT